MIVGSGLLTRPHHDGSGRYVSNLSPEVGDTVTVRVRIPHENLVSDVFVRAVADAEPYFVAATAETITPTETWWTADLVCHNVVTSYRFILAGGQTSYRWLNGNGVHARDVPDAADFRLVAGPGPAPWASDAVVYQIFLDRFAKSVERTAPDWALPARWEDPVDAAAGSVARQLYGGDLDGILEHLDHIQELGATVVYLTPFFPAGSNHRYDATSFSAVDPLLGGDQALHRLIQALHERGLRVLGDLTTNHTGVAHEWFRKATADPQSLERSFYFIDGGGEGLEYASWLNVPSLPKLNHASTALRQRMFADPEGVAGRWVRFGLDGWRVDVANMTGRYRNQDVNHEVARAMRAAVVAARPDGLLVAEHCHDYSGDATADGWHGFMNYVGFTRPTWTWLRDDRGAPSFLGSPVMVPRLGGEAVMQTMQEFAAIVPWRTVVNSFNLVGSHDTTRVRTLVGEDARKVDVAAALLFTMPGIPMLTYGDEIGMAGDFGEDGRKPMPWDAEPWDDRLHEVYKALIAIRRSLPALRHGGLRWAHASDDALAYVRETAEQAVFVHCARAAHDQIALDARHLPGIEAAVAVYGRDLAHADGRVFLSANGPEVNIWAYAPK